MDVLARRAVALIFFWVAFLFVGAALAMTLWPDPHYSWHAAAGSVVITIALGASAMRLWRRRPPD